MIKITYIVDISDLDKAWERIEKRTKYTIRKCGLDIIKSDDIERFDYMHWKTRPDRKIPEGYLEELYKDLKNEDRCQLYFTETAGAFISWDKKRGYYLFGARDKTRPDGSPSKILWKVMQDLNKWGFKEFDLCGANKQNIKFFKRGFGGRLTAQTKKHYIPQF